MIGIRFDLRVPPFSKATHAEQYAACLDQCAWADQAGLDVAVLSEHHGVDDGYMTLAGDARGGDRGPHQAHPDQHRGGAGAAARPAAARRAARDRLAW